MSQKARVLCVRYLRLGVYLHNVKVNVLQKLEEELTQCKNELQEKTKQLEDCQGACVEAENEYYEASDRIEVCMYIVKRCCIVNEMIYVLYIRSYVGTSFSYLFDHYIRRNCGLITTCSYVVLATQMQVQIYMQVLVYIQYSHISVFKQDYSYVCMCILVK